MDRLNRRLIGRGIGRRRYSAGWLMGATNLLRALSVLVSLTAFSMTQISAHAQRQDSAESSRMSSLLQEIERHSEQGDCKFADDFTDSSLRDLSIEGK